MVLNEATDMYITGLQELVKERLATNNALQSDTAIAADDADASPHSGAMPMSMLTEGLDRIAAVQMPRAHDEQFKASKQPAESWRQSARSRRALAQPYTKRDRTLSRTTSSTRR